MTLTGKIWVILADGEHARALTPMHTHGQFKTVLSFDSVAAHMMSHDLGSERPGRVHESASATRHSITPREDLHEAAKHAFVAEVAKEIGVHAGEFERLVLVAPAHALHDLRNALGDAARAKLVGTLAKDLTKTPDHGLVSHLGEWWHPPVEAI